MSFIYKSYEFRFLLYFQVIKWYLIKYNNLDLKGNKNWIIPKEVIIKGNKHAYTAWSIFDENEISTV